MDSSLMNKLKILADSAKYDVSCSSSGVERKNSGRRGSASNAGICHSWSADGRCISLLKVLFTNKCAYDCQYCTNRRSVDVQRASFEPAELAELTMEFYRRNYIEGLFLSSAVEVSPDYTAERILQCLSMLRYDYGFAGYIHAKIIPGVSQELTHAIGLVADRLSVNIELPTEASLQRLAPQKKAKAIFTPMTQITNTLIQQRSLKGPGTMFKGENLNDSLHYLHPEGKTLVPTAGAQVHLGEGSLYQMSNGGEHALIREPRYKYKEKFCPAGQTTQMIIGAGTETDRQIVKTSESLYRSFKMKRVYFSAYIPISDSPLLPSVFTAPPLTREHRLYQADWLLRFYGFTAEEMFTESEPNLDLELDPKITWALRNIQLFPIEVNKASMEELLRIPGLGTVSALRILRQRKVSAVKYDDLKKMGVVLKRARFFLTCSGKYYGEKELSPEYVRSKVLESDRIKSQLLPPKEDSQLSMFTPGSFRLEAPDSLHPNTPQRRLKTDGGLLI
ncbi:putative DNA modification/repair radical SAM protein [Aminipila butyrica]|uniref:Putative DNA modification/repair radical SAM protein n=1 Tax=Aminipila butyrica TaxID=433296 RepID=A0A858BZN8_9FIRM|nr:putative DNA modification/repair radical SAM protein [Aminipila butyrica]QIB70628.1 putative DNA modification/repair radical SAM protein [Aminipila butyrica]